MKSQRMMESIVGFFMLLGLAALLFLALKVSGLSGFLNQDSYIVHTQFSNIGGLQARAPVTIAGVRVGQVESIQLNPKSFEARVILSIHQGTRIPADSSASILTQGILGANYVSLTPGYDSTMLKNGGKIATTHPALILENLIGQFMYKINGDK